MRVNPLALLVGFVLFAAVLTHVLPAGRFERRDDAATGRTVVVPGSYRAVPASPVGPFQAAVAIPKGMVAGASLIFLVFIAGGAFGVVERTGALRHGVEWMADRLQSRERLVVPISCVFFATGGVVEGMWEEIIALVPVLLVLTRRVGFDAVTAVGMSLGAAGVGAAFSPMNPFGVGIAQKFAELPLMSGWAFRVAVLVPAVVLWTAGTLRHALRTRTTPEAPASSARVFLGWRHGLTLAVLVGTFPLLAVGVLQYGWDLEQMSAAFFLMGVATGLLGGLGVRGLSDAFIDGCRSMVYAALMLGVARSIFVVLDEGRIVDTIVNALVTPLAQFPVAVFAAGVSVVQSLLALPVPSSSGRVALTMPIYVPLSDLLGLSRQTLVTATQYWPGMLGQLLPTDGALMAVLALAGVSYQQWLRFAAPLCAALMLLGLVALGVAVALDVQ
jgi:uncharacterized ion transporter superfamily protein YfcC